MTGATESQVTVLLVDDEPGVRVVARLGLKQAGYVVLEAADGAQAIRLSEAHPGPIHLLLTDLHLPSLSGEQVAAAVRARYPEVRVILTSGETDAQVDRVPGAAFLSKPFTPSTLAAKVRELLAD